MQNKGAIRLFAILLAAVCLFQLSFTWKTRSVEKQAKEFANSESVRQLAKKLAAGDVTRENVVFDSISKVRERYFFDSISAKPVFLFGKYTYKECKEHELNLGLDLKGGMNVTLEVSVVDIIKALANNTQNVAFNKAIAKAQEMQKTKSEDFVTSFDKAFTEVAPNASLAAPDIFSTREFKDKGISSKSTNKEVIAALRKEVDLSIDRTFNILRNRIDKFGVTQPNIQKLEKSGRILVELPGVKDKERARKVLQTTAELQFWLTFENKDVYPIFERIDKELSSILSKGKDTASKNDTTKELAEVAKKDSLKSDKVDTASLVNKSKGKTKDVAAKASLFQLLSPAGDSKNGLYPGAVVGYAQIKDTAVINSYFKLPQVKSLLPREMKIAWAAKPEKKSTVLQLFALKAVNSRDSKGAVLIGDKIVDAYQDYSQTGGVEVVMVMNSEGANSWKHITADNKGNCIAVLLDNYVQTAPRVNDEIPNGRSTITGNYEVNEAKDLANVLKAGKLPAPARIVSEEMVGPSLGQDSINAGFASVIIGYGCGCKYHHLRTCS